MPAEKPTATISTPEMIAPMLGMKASRPVSKPSSAAIGTPPTSAASAGDNAFDQHADDAAGHQAAQREADLVADLVEAGAIAPPAASRRSRGRRACGSIAMKMPMTMIIRIEVTTPIAVLTAVVSRPTPPSSCWLKLCRPLLRRHQVERDRR